MNDPAFEDGCSELDRNDTLGRFRELFHVPLGKSGEPKTYLCGNSLGLQPKKARSFVEQELDDWASLGVDGHFDARNPWLSYHELLSAPLARLTGARDGEVVAMNTLTVNLHLLLTSFYRPRHDRFRVLTAHTAFPSDRYAIASQVRLHGYSPEEAIVEIRPPSGEHAIRSEQIEEVLAKSGSSVALVLMDGVNYYTGQALDMKRISSAARAAGCQIGFDLAHAIGNVPLELHEWGVDFAVWCSYKYLNGGPGCIGGAFVHERHARERLPRLAGWWGHDKSTRFKMGPDFAPIPGAEGWQLSNPPILPLAALRASLEIFDEAGLAELRAKSVRLTGYMEWLLRRRMGERVTILTPSDPDARGCQLSIRVPAGRRAFDRLMEEGVVCDWREPDAIRVAPVPLYNTFRDVERFVEILSEGR